MEASKSPVGLLATTRIKILLKTAGQSGLRGLTTKEFERSAQSRRAAKMAPDMR
jgi:hypothetical protein